MKTKRFAFLSLLFCANSLFGQINYFNSITAGEPTFCEDGGRAKVVKINADEPRNEWQLPTLEHSDGSNLTVEFDFAILKKNDFPPTAAEDNFRNGGVD